MVEMSAGHFGSHSAEIGSYLRFKFHTTYIKHNKFREWSFLILGTGADDISQGYETFCYHSVGVLNF